MEVADMKNLDLPSLLDASIDDLADLPSMEAPPTGHYNLELKIEVRKINDKDAVTFNYTIVDILEVPNMESLEPADQPKVGQKFSEAFILGNEYAVGRLKQSLKPIGEHFGVSTIKDIISAGESGVQIAATIKRRIVDRNGEEAKYASASNIVVQ